MSAQTIEDKMVKRKDSLSHLKIKKEQLDNIDKRLINIGKSEEYLKLLNEELFNIKKVINSGRLSNNDVGNIDIKIAAIEKKLTGLNELGQALKNYNKVKLQNSKNKEKADELKLEISFYDSLAKALDKEKISKYLVRQKLVNLNERLAHMRNITGKPVTIDDELNLSVGGQPVYLSSTSEGIRVTMALIDAISYCHGIKFLFSVDEINSFDSVRKSSFLNLSVQLLHYYKHVMLFASIQSVPILPDHNVPIKMWYVREGSVKELDKDGIDEIKSALGS